MFDDWQNGHAVKPVMALSDVAYSVGPAAVSRKLVYLSFLRQRPARCESG
jgi:hypothetical protein